MAIVTIKASKATPNKAISYITDPQKAALVDLMNLDASQDLADQILATAKLWGKAQNESDRKYYHLKIAFAPEDWVENGGTLTEREALQIGMAIMREFCPTSEGVGSVHIDKKHLHFHGVINAVDMESGKMLDMRNADYRRLKDRVKEVCTEKGLNAIDWRKATAEKRQREVQAAEPINETFAEQGLKARGKTTWKDDLREKIDQAAASCSSMDEFRAVLESQGVTLTRCTNTTISYKLGDQKACRGDSLGGDYTVAAIRDALQHNSQEPVPEAGKEHAGIDDLISSAARKSEAQAAGGRVIGQKEREIYRELGRLAGFKRAEIDELCDQAPKATWEEKQAAWANYKAAKAEFWDEYANRQQILKNAVDDAYKRRRKVKAAEWALDPRNRRKSLFGVIYAGIVLSRNESWMIEREIQTLKQEQQQLRRDMVAFKNHTGEARETLREKGLSLDAYMASVERMQSIADEIQKKNAEFGSRKMAQIEKKGPTR